MTLDFVKEFSKNLLKFKYAIPGDISFTMYSNINDRGELENIKVDSFRLNANPEVINPDKTTILDISENYFGTNRFHLFIFSENSNPGGKLIPFGNINFKKFEEEILVPLRLDYKGNIEDDLFNEKN